MKGVNSDGSRFASECDVNNDGTADVLTDDITFSVRGFISARFVISDALRSYNTQRFLIYVDDAFNPDITSDERFSILERLIREIQLIDEHGGILVDDVKITDGTARITAQDFEKGYVVVRKGKKVFRKIVIG